jgi:hypothetical protein
VGLLRIMGSSTHLLYIKSLRSSLYSSRHYQPSTSTLDHEYLNINMDTEYDYELTAQKYCSPLDKINSEADRNHSSDPRTTSLSFFERLPLELRQMIYVLLEYSIGSRIAEPEGEIATESDEEWWLDTVRAKILRYEFWRWDTSPASEYGTGHILAKLYHPRIPRWRRPARTIFWYHCYDKALLFVNRNLRAELISSMFGNIEIVFNFQLSDKALHYSRPESSWTFCNSRSEGLYRMLMPNMDFHCLTTVTIGQYAGNTFSTNVPHTRSRISTRTVIAKQALSIQYLAKHCLSLRTFRVIPGLGNMGTGSNGRRRASHGISSRALQPMIQALVQLAVMRETLDVIIFTRQWRVEQIEMEELLDDESGCSTTLEDEKSVGEYTIVLKDVPWSLRENRVLDATKDIFKLLACAKNAPES